LRFNIANSDDTGLFDTGGQFLQFKNYLTRFHAFGNYQAVWIVLEQTYFADPQKTHAMETPAPQANPEFILFWLTIACGLTVPLSGVWINVTYAICEFLGFFAGLDGELVLI